MPEFILHTVVLIAMIISSYIDIRIREVPDFLSHGIMAAGVGFAALLAVQQSSWEPIGAAFLGTFAMVVLALISFYTGQWGGGDAKLLIGMGAVFGLTLPLSFNQPLVSFVINLLVAGGAYGLLWALALVIKNWKSFYKELKLTVKQKQVRVYKYLSFGIAGLLFIAAILVQDFQFKLFFAMFAALMILAYIFLASAKAIEKSCMEKMIPIKKLTEGDWIVEDVKIAGKYICGPKDLGISKSQIQTLIEYQKKGKIKNVKIKEGIPFVPSFLIAYILTIGWGNVILKIVGL